MEFATAIERVLGHEGGYVNDPRDPGGETNWGITVGFARAHGYTGDMAKMTREEAKVLYEDGFWDLLGLNSMPHPLRFQLLDFAVNSGPETALRAYQRALGVADDGKWGPVSQARANEIDAGDAVMLLLAERLEFMTRLKAWSDFSRGWARRIAQNLRYGAHDT